MKPAERENQGTGMAHPFLQGSRYCGHQANEAYRRYPGFTRAWFETFLFTFRMLMSWSSRLSVFDFMKITPESGGPNDH